VELQEPEHIVVRVIQVLVLVLVALEVQVLHLMEVQVVMAQGADLGRVVLFM
jgi:hypothetical protein